MPQSTKNQDQKLAWSDPNIGAILTESSRQLDKINKMLEEHRKKKVYENVGNGGGSFVVTHENPVIPEVREEAYRSVRNRQSNSKESKHRNYECPYVVKRYKTQRNCFSTEYE